MSEAELQQQVQTQIQSNDMAGAYQTLLQLTALVPSDLNALAHLAWAQLNLGKIQDAIDTYLQVIKINPNIPNVNFFLAMAYGQAGQTKNARRYFVRVIDLDSNNIDAMVKVAHLDFMTGNTASTLKFLTKAKSIKPDHVELNVRFGRLYTAMNEFDSAIKHYKKALSIDANNLEAIGQLASLYSFSDDSDAALKLLQPYLSKKPVDSSIAIVFASICRRLKRCDEAKEYLQEILKNKIDPITESSILFSLGKIHDRNEDYNEAFKSFKRANDLNDFPYLFLEERQGVLAMQNVLNDTFFNNISYARNLGKNLKPVFIIGMPRSGTSLVEQIVSSHPLVHGAGESMEISNIASSLQVEINTATNYPFCISEADQTLLTNKAKQYLKEISKKAPKNAKIITDKLPDNYKHLALIQLLFPKAKIIHCVRDPRDNCLSCYFNQLMGNAYTYNLENLGKHYGLYDTLMKHWKKVLTLPILDVSYEDMIADTETVSKEIIDFCGLEWTDKCLDFHENKRNVVTASSDQVRQPIYTKSVARWKHYESHLGELMEALKHRV